MPQDIRDFFYGNLLNCIIGVHSVCFILGSNIIDGENRFGDFRQSIRLLTTAN